MRWRIGRTLALTTGCALAPCLTAIAEIADTTNSGTTAGTNSDGTVIAEAGTGAVVSGVVYTSGGSSGPKCSWDRYSNFEVEQATGTPPR